MPISINFRMDEDELVKLLDYYGPNGLNLPIGINRSRMLAAIIHGHVEHLIADNKVPSGPLDLGYLERRLREILYQRSQSGQQQHISSKRLRAEQAASLADVDIPDTLKNILNID